MEVEPSNEVFGFAGPRAENQVGFWLPGTGRFRESGVRVSYGSPMACVDKHASRHLIGESPLNKARAEIVTQLRNGATVTAFAHEQGRCKEHDHNL